MKNASVYHSLTPLPSCRSEQLKKTVAGIGLLTTTVALKSRNTAQSCGFFVRAPFFGGSFGGAQARRLSSSAVVPVVQLRSSCHPRLDSCVAVVLRRQLEPHMAQILTFPTKLTAPVQQHRTPGRNPKCVVSLQKHKTEAQQSNHLEVLRTRYESAFRAAAQAMQDFHQASKTQGVAV